MLGDGWGGLGRGGRGLGLTEGVVDVEAPDGMWGAYGETCESGEKCFREGELPSACDEHRSFSLLDVKRRIFNPKEWEDSFHSPYRPPSKASHQLSDLNNTVIFDKIQFEYLNAQLSNFDQAKHRAGPLAEGSISARDIRE